MAKQLTVDRFNKAEERWAARRWIAAAISFTTFYRLLLLACGLAAVGICFQMWKLLPVRADNSYPEAAPVLASLRWAQGLPLYGDFRQPPYLVTAFPPLWYSILAFGAKLGFSDLDSLTLFGRLLSVVSLLGVIALAYAWNRRLGITARLAALSPVLYLTFPVLIPWAVTVRPDFPSLLLSVLALYLIGEKPTAAFVALAASAAAMAFLMRHNAVAAPTAIVLWLLWLRRYKHATLFCFTWALLVVGALSIGNAQSHGMLLLNLSGAKFGRMALTYSRDSLFRILVLMPGHGFAVILAAFGTLGAIYSLQAKDHRSRVVALYLAISLALAFVGSSAAGGDINHYLEAALAMAILSPLALTHIERGWTADSPSGAFAILVTMFLLLPAVDMQRWNAMHTNQPDMRNLQRVVEKYRVFTDIPYLAARSSRPQAIDLASLTYAERAGQWSSEFLLKQFQQGQYSAVILAEPVTNHTDSTQLYPRYPHLNGALQRVITEQYRLCYESAGAYVYGRLAADGQNVCPAQAQN